MGSTQLSLFSFFETNYSQVLKREYKGNSVKKRAYFSQSKIAKGILEDLLLSLVRELKLERNELEELMQKSPLQNIAKHIRMELGKKSLFPRYFVVIDIKKAYENTSFKMISDFLRKKGVTDELIEKLREMSFTPDKRIITGATSSPFLFNYYCEKTIDEKLERYMHGKNIVYTRFFDDLIFSSQEPIGLRKRKRFLEIIRGAGYESNSGKMRVLDLAHGPILLNGFFISYDKKKGSCDITLDRKQMRKIESVLQNAIAKPKKYKREFVDGTVGTLKHLCRRKGFATVREQKLLDLYLSYSISAPPSKLKKRQLERWYEPF